MAFHTPASIVAVSLMGVLLAVGCGNKRDHQPADPSLIAPTTTTTPVPVPAATVTVDPASFAPVKLGAIAALTALTIKAPAGTTVTADAPSMMNPDQGPQGAVLTSGALAIHVAKQTLGELKTVVDMKASMEVDRSKVALTTNTTNRVDYTITSASGGKRYGFAQTASGSSEYVCEPASPQPTEAALAPYRAICGTAAVK